MATEAWVKRAGSTGELPELQRALEHRESGWILIDGPSGAGKSGLVRELVAARKGTVSLQASPMTDEDLLADFRGAIMDELGEIPTARGPGLLPDPGGMLGWRQLFLGLATRTTAAGRTLLIVFDDWDLMIAARRRLSEELAEALEVARRRGPSIVVVLTVRSGTDSAAFAGLPEPIARLRLGPLPLRAAARAQGGTDPEDAFLRWACLGGHPAHLPSGDPESNWEEAVVERVLRSSGDLHDAPIRRLQATFQRPARYGSILRALGAGPVEWGPLLDAARGVGTGGQLAPYLRRLEEEGLVTSERPLGADEGARNRRYRLTDPFWAFWMTCVLPARSRLLHDDPWRVWRERIRPSLSLHLDRWLPRAVHEWFQQHASERFSSASREVGALWGGQPRFDTVAWLMSGQICYVGAHWIEGVAEATLYDDLRARMTETRHGIGREARAPVLVLPGDVTEELRRRVARDPLARILDLSDLMGSP